MISLIICSTREYLNPILANNIAETIGTAYEVVHIDNSQGKYNIFEAYNQGIEQAKGEYLCFMHEDIMFHSNNWGCIVEKYLSQSFVGALGVAGGNVVLDKLDWRFYGFGYVHLLQGTSTIEENPHYYISYDSSNSHLPLMQVAVLDGVWICIRKELFKTIRFDDRTFHDFHLYDSDICMQVNQQGMGVFMTHDILLEHKSEGTFSKGYADSLAVFSKKWKDSLPLVKGTVVSSEEMEEALYKAFPLFEKRLNHDAIVISLRQLFKMRKEGLPVRDYTTEEKEMMDKSAFTYRKYCIKNKDMPNEEVKRLIAEYCQLPFARKKLKLKLKYIWYRILGIGKKN